MRRQPDDPPLGRGPALVATLLRLTTGSTSGAARPAEDEALTLTAQVTGVDGRPCAATGAVRFLAAGAALGEARLDASGRAELPDVRLRAGLHPLTASYAGDDAHAGSTSRPLPQAVGPVAAEVLVLVAAPLRTPSGVLLEAELVDPQTGRLVEDAVGPLAFTAGTTLLADGELERGHARVLVPALPEGPLQVAFRGDVEHAPATGTAR